MKTAALGLALGLVVGLGACVAPPPPPPPPAPVVIAPPPPPLRVVAPPAVVAPPVVVERVDPFGTVLAGILDLPRVGETGAIDGCRKVHRGLTMGGGFLFFTCEKLRPGVALARQAEIAGEYQSMLESRGWVRAYNARKKHDEFTRFDANGCKMTVSVRPWTDRSLNEPRARSREGFRQIVFMTHFAKGDACKPAYRRLRRAGYRS